MNKAKKEKLTPPKAKSLMKLKGEARGSHFVCDAQYVLKEKGKKGLNKVQNKLKEVGFPLNYQGVKSMNFYPIGLRALSLWSIRDTFGWDNQKIEDLSEFAPKVSLIVKIFAKYFRSFSKTLEQLPQIWKEYFTVGKLEVKEESEKKKFFILQIKDFDIHPLLCIWFSGFIKFLTQIVTQSKKVKVEEIKCTFRGDNSHQFKIKWQ